MVPPETIDNCWDAAVSVVVCRDPCYQSHLANYDGQNSHALAPTALVSLTFLVCGPQKQLITVETWLFLLLFAEIHGYHTAPGNYNGQNSHALAPTALVSITFLIYGPQKQLITVQTQLFLLLFAEIHGYQSHLRNYDVQNSHVLAPTALVSMPF